MTKREAAIVSAYTGYVIGEFSDSQAYAEEVMGPVFWSVEDKQKYEKESMNKFDPYKYAREAFAKYEAENHNYTCSDCSQCRYDDAIGVYYCRRSFTTIYQPEEMSACDDFEKGE